MIYIILLSFKKNRYINKIEQLILENKDERNTYDEKQN